MHTHVRKCKKNTFCNITIFWKTRKTIRGLKSKNGDITVTCIEILKRLSLNHQNTRWGFLLGN